MGSAQEDERIIEISVNEEQIIENKENFYATL